MTSWVPSFVHVSMRNSWSQLYTSETTKQCTISNLISKSLTFQNLWREPRTQARHLVVLLSNFKSQVHNNAVSSQVIKPTTTGKWLNPPMLSLNHTNWRKHKPFKPTHFQNNISLISFTHDSRRFCTWRFLKALQYTRSPVFHVALLTSSFRDGESGFFRSEFAKKDPQNSQVWGT